MTIPVQRSRKIISGSGWSNPLAHDYPIENVTDVKVFADSEELTLGVHYSVSGVGDPTGYTVNITDPGDWSPEVWVLDVQYPINQPSDVDQGGQFGARFEAAIDRMARSDQVIYERALRSLAVNRTTPLDAEIELPPRQAGGIFGWDANGENLENKGTIPEIQTVAAHLAQIDTVSASIAAVTAVADEIAAILAVAPIAGEVSVVAGIAGSVVAVAGNETNIDTVAADIASVNTAATNMPAIIAAPAKAAEAAEARDWAWAWSSAPEDETVDDGVNPPGNSSYHWAQKAEETAQQVVGGIAAAVHAATAKAALDDADEMGLADSAASWGLKKFTLANLISSIFKTTRTIANGQFAAASFKLFNAAGTPRALTLNLAALTADRAIAMPDRAVDLGNVPAAAAFISAPFTAALGSNGLISHGLPSAPKKFSAYVVLTATVSAMAAGDVLKADYGVVASTAYGVQLSIPSGNTTQIKYQVASGGIATVLNATGASATGVPSASGQIIIIAEL